MTGPEHATDRPQLQLAEIISRATAGTGLQDHLTPGLRERLERTVARFNASAAFTEDNIGEASKQVEATLAARLQVERDRGMYPDIGDEKVEAPLVILGFSRTGTTVMQCLLGCDPAHRRVTWAESMFPSPPPGLNDSEGELSRTENAFEHLTGWIKSTGILPGHPYHDLGLQAPVEDEELFALDFLGDYPTRYFRVPFHPVDTSTDDPARAYIFLREILQYYQWRRPKRRWVLKGIYHSFALETFFEFFPDARCIWTHRDPLAMIPSTLQLTYDVYDPIQKLPHTHHSQRLLTAMRAGFDTFMSSPFLSDPRIHHVRFQDFMADQIGVIKGAYDYFSMPFTPEAEAAMRLWLADPANRPDRYGKFKYDATELGLDSKVISEMFSDYTDRFNLA